MTHDELVERAVRWLKGTGKCGVAVPELVTYASENPDAIGWKDQGLTSIMIECKISRADFLADRKKWVRRQAERGVGDLRYYMTIDGVISPEELPKNWGLLIVRGRTVRCAVKADRQPSSVKASQIMMYSLLRRSSLRGDLTRCLSPKWGGDMLSTVVP